MSPNVAPLISMIRLWYQFSYIYVNDGVMFSLPVTIVSA